MHKVLISLSSFGAAEVRRHGQLFFARLGHAAGADGVEVRGELLADPAVELPALATAVRETGLGAVYSSPEGLWHDDGALDDAALARALDAAALLGAACLKMSIGGFGANSLPTLQELQQRLGRSAVELLIENDQTAAAGSLAAMRVFFGATETRGLPLGMTFDMGNWHWAGECPLQAATALAPRVRYVHCKGVQRQPKRWVAVPLVDSAAPWRAVLSALPADVPWAIEYPLAGDDLLATTRNEILQLRAIAAQAQATS
ncbi:MAG TPA: TIM barrel protein [Ramlibacter sp.]|nr:TIM barrel protein [Ramlibacter sp.]